MTAETMEDTRMAVEPYRNEMASGVRALAVLSDDEFDRNLEALKAGQDRVAKIQRTLMTPGVDYGTVPGTKRPTLMKPGAEKLTLAYGLVAEIKTELVEGDGEAAPALRYDSACYLHVGTFEGPVVAVGHGTASSHEVKYRYRTQRFGVECPDCHREGVIKTRRNVFWHPPDAEPDGGCDGNFAIDDPRLAEQRPRTERVLNPDPWDVANTLLKMSEKRSHVDSVLRATATSGLFTQDVEDAHEATVVELPDEPPADDWSNEAFRTRLLRRNVSPVEALTMAETHGTWKKGEPFGVEQRQALIGVIDEVFAPVALVD